MKKNNNLQDHHKTRKNTFLTVQDFAAREGFMYYYYINTCTDHVLT